MPVPENSGFDHRRPPASVGRFPAGLFLDKTFSDIEECATAEPGWDQTYHQLGRGRFQGRVIAGHTSSVQFAIEEWSPGLLIRGAAPAGAVVFGVLASGRERPYYHGRVLHDDEVGTLLSGEDIDLQLGQPSIVVSASIDRELVEQYTSAVWGEPLSARRVRDRMKLSNPTLREAVRHTIRDSCEFARCAPDRLRDERVVKTLEHEVLDAFLLEIQTPKREPRLAERNHAARQALDYLMAHLNQPVTVAELCVAVGVTARTLQLGCQERFGLSPKALLRSLQFDAVHKRLLRAQPTDTVFEIARTCGFLHAGRFAVEYRRRFGESPSQTLQHALHAASS
jgi:AraC family transcriptional regulator, ethanolamine operon transcriptional activator